MEEETRTEKTLWLYFCVTVKLHTLELTATQNRLFCGAVLGAGGLPVHV